MSQPATIAQHQLTRTQEKKRFDEHTYSFMDPFMSGKETRDWSCSAIETACQNLPKRIVHEYLVYPEAQAYIIATAHMHETSNPDRRFTSMRLWEMVVDSFLAAGGKPDGLRFLGVNWIVNEAALKAIASEFVEERSVRHVTIHGEDAQVITLVGMRKYANPFIRCASRVAEALSEAAGRDVVLKAVHVVRMQSYVHHMVCEFETNELVVAGDGPSVPGATPATDKTGPVKRSLSRKGGDAIKRTLSRLIRRNVG